MKEVVTIKGMWLSNYSSTGGRKERENLPHSQESNLGPTLYQGVSATELFILAAIIAFPCLRDTPEVSKWVTCKHVPTGVYRKFFFYIHVEM